MNNYKQMINNISGVVNLNNFIKDTHLSQLSDDDLTLLHKKAATINSGYNCDGALSVISAELTKRSSPKPSKLTKNFQIIVGVATIIGAIIGVIQLF